MGGKTIGLYRHHGVAVTIGLLVVNAIKPGDRLPNETKAQLEAKYKADATKRQEATETVKERGPYSR